MKHILTGLFAVLVANLVTAQNGLIITPGAQLTMSGNATLTLQNANLISNGTFESGNGSVRMTGTAGFNDKTPPVGGVLHIVENDTINLFFPAPILLY